jgi:hypothetical protein
MAYSSSDTSGSGSGRSRSLKLQPTATGPMDLSEFYTNKGYVSETWWKDYFMTARAVRGNQATASAPRHRRDVEFHTASDRNKRTSWKKRL